MNCEPLYLAYTKPRSVSKGKVTQAVRRILMSQKTFANHLADEEAALSALAQQPLATHIPRPASKVTKTPVSRLKRSSTSASTPAPTPPEPTAQEVLPSPAIMPYAMAPPSTITPSQDDANPLLRSYVPSAPSEATLDALVAAPPLSYNMARARPSSSGRPQRHFCEICGYWGRVKCMKCGARVCGLECKGTHDEGRCLRFYA